MLSLERRSGSDGLSIKTPAATWRCRLGTRLQAFLSSWEGDGLASTDGALEPATVLLRADLWRHLADLGPGESSEARELLAELVSWAACSWSITARSFIGAARLEVELQCNGQALEPGVSVLALPSGVPTPEGLALVETVTSWNARDTHPVAAQFELVARLQVIVAACRETGEPVVLDPHLGGFQIERPDAVSLAWEVSPRRPDLFDLKAEISGGDGSRQSIPIEKLDRERPVAQLGHKRVLLFDDETAAALRNVGARHQSRSRRDVHRVLHDPAGVMPEGVAPEKIELGEYSHRVAGFEKVVRAVRPEDIQSSGIRWFDGGAAAAGEPFLEMDVTSSPSTPPVRLLFETPEDVLRVRDTLAKELERSNPVPVKVGEAEVIPSEPLKERLEFELEIYRGGQPGTTREAPKPPPRLAAVIDENAVFETEEGARLLENVPWANLEAVLRPGIQLKDHQKAGLAWLWYHLESAQPGVLLADDMGLGKTLQVASLLALAGCQANASGPSLIVAPVALLENWRDELEKFFLPDTFGEVLVLYGPGLDACRVGTGLDHDRLRAAGLVITNYETLARYQVALLKQDWNIVALDEAHNIKNPDALRTRASCGLKRRFAICMTGTPVENKLLDLWSLFFFLSPGSPFGQREQFTQQSASGAEFVRTRLEYPSVRSRVLRRTKAVLDLPPKNIRIHDIPLSLQQVGLERSVVQRAESTLAALGQLRKLYAHPLLLRDDADVRKDWSLDAAMRWSPKFVRCLELLEEIRGRGEKALVFSQFIDMQALIAQAVQERFSLRHVGIINGGTNQAGRTKTVLNAFDKSTGFDVLVLSPLAAGVGLNIVAANHVIHYDRWWNPAKEDQATDRAYRIGQTKPVHVHYLLLHQPDDPSAGFDKRLHDLVGRKRDLARDFLAPTDAMEITPSELLGIFEGEVVT